MLIFKKENISNGWSLWYKICLINIAFIIILIPFSKKISDSVSLTLGLIVVLVFITLFIFNFFGKSISEKKYTLKINRFIGWSIFWRWIMMYIPFQIVLSLPAGIVRIFVKKLQEDYIATGIVPNLATLFCSVFVLVIIAAFCNLTSLGWATTTAIKNIRVRNGVRS